MTDNRTIEQLGLVVSYFGNSVAVEADNGQVFQCHLRRNQQLPVVGDRVRWQLDGNSQTGTIDSVEERQSILGRDDGKGGLKPIAANIDRVVIVMAPPPIFSEYLVDRYLIAAELLKLEPIIVVNKADLLDEASQQALQERLQVYRAVPYAVSLSSVKIANGLTELIDLLGKKTAVLVGPSGVGKSSIISALGEDSEIKIGDVSAKGAGKHTTTATRLYHIPQGGQLIDSPGVREFNLWPVTKQEILRGFKEFMPHTSGCKFRDCQHTVEPGCAVQQAVVDGKISAIRFASYQAFMKKAKKNDDQYSS